jgi:3-deoxy-D-arabino-heptulosonate 7-phosphate (DAHP) synthase
VGSLSIIQGKRAVGSAQLIVPVMFHGSISCGADGIIYEFFTQPVRAVLA